MQNLHKVCLNKFNINYYRSNLIRSKYSRYLKIDCILLLNYFEHKHCTCSISLIEKEENLLFFLPTKQR